MSGHTPGLWIVSRFNDEILAESEDDEIPLKVAKVQSYIEGAFTPEKHEVAHNARLIAAAPDMLRALKGASALIHTNASALIHTTGPSLVGSAVSAAVGLIDDAIARAEGKA